MHISYCIHLEYYQVIVQEIVCILQIQDRIMYVKSRLSKDNVFRILKEFICVSNRYPSVTS